MTICPGKKIKSLISGVWNRDLDIDLAGIKAWGACAVVTLIEDNEFEQMAVKELPVKAKSFGIEWYHLPIKDVCPPGKRFAGKWKNDGPRLRRSLHEGGKILIHCRGGLGRTGTVAAQLLVEFGVAPQDAITKVRSARPGAIETAQQEKYVYQQRPIENGLNSQHFAGCLLGGAVGDALGAPVEFMSSQEIRKKYGINGIANFDSAFGKVGTITDDTQMTLFTAEGLLRAHCRWRHRGIGPIHDSMVHRAYNRWLFTQGEVPEGEIYVPRDGWLLTIQELHSRRAPGNSCLSALKSGRMGTIEQPINNSKGCGGVMRAAPVGLYGAVASEYFRGSGKEIVAVFDLGCNVAAITHGHPSGYLPAGVFAAIIYALLSGQTLLEAIKATIPLLMKMKGHEETLKAITQATDSPKNGAIRPGPDVIERMGGGWVGEEALAISLYCALSSEGDFSKGVRLAVNHGGDSDSTGSITGNILGAMHGKQAIPEEWLDQLERRDVVEAVADDLLTLFQDTDAWWKKYPGY
ncbi:MAG: ADP-ribosylglycohydrolase family protein [Syntrophales bacterium]